VSLSELLGAHPPTLFGMLTFVDGGFGDRAKSRRGLSIDNGTLHRVSLFGNR
jgi:hypothetical protein